MFQHVEAGNKCCFTSKAYPDFTTSSKWRKKDPNNNNNNQKRPKKQQPQTNQNRLTRIQDLQ